MPSFEGLPSNIATLIEQVERGDREATNELFTVLYAELHRLSRRALARHGTSGLSATSLLHEAYLDISRRTAGDFPDTARFMGYAARVMRGLIIDYSRHRQALKRGGAFEITSLATDAWPAVSQGELTRISEALDELAQTEPALATIVDLKFFCGFSFAEIASMQQTSERTAQRKWEKARIYLYQALRVT